MTATPDNTAPNSLQAIVIVHFTEGSPVPDYVVIGDESVRLFIVDETAPHDRVYEWTSRQQPERFRQLIPADATIGNKDDEHTAALEKRINAFLTGRTQLSVVK